MASTDELLRCSECGSGEDALKCRYCDKALCCECCTEIQSELRCCAAHEAMAVSDLKVENRKLRVTVNLSRGALERIVSIGRGSTAHHRYAEAVGAMEGRAEYVLERMK